jgi:LysM repeat protein
MKVLKNGFVGLLAALFTSLLVVGAITLAMTEGMTLPAPITPEPQPTGAIETLFPEFSSTNRPTSAPRLVEATNLPILPTCPIVPGWETYTVLNGDTLNSLAAIRKVTREELMEKNCLVGTSLVAGSRLFLPALPKTETPPLPASATPAVRCGPPQGWSRYTIQPGDTLFRLSTIYAVSVPELQQANCLGWSTTIRTGDAIYVPNVTPRYTATATALPTATRVPPTITPSGIPTLPSPPSPSRTFTATLRPTATPTFTVTYTATITSSPTATIPNTATLTGTYTRTATSTPTSTFTPTLKVNSLLLQ